MPRAEEEHGTTASFVSDHNDHRHDCDDGDVVGGFIKMLRLDRGELNSEQVLEKKPSCSPTSWMTLFSKF